MRLGPFAIGADEGKLPGRSPAPFGNHGGCVNIIFCDGHGRSIGKGIDQTIYARLVTPEGSQYGQQAFDEGLDASCRLAFRVAYSVLRNREDAEEVAQEAMLKAHRKLPTLRQQERFRSWLVRIAWRLAIDRQRADRRRQRREQAEPVALEEPSPEDLTASGEMRIHLWRAIDELPEIHRKVLILATIEEHDMQSVARLLNLPAGTVKSRLHKARKKLLEKLKWIADGSNRR